MLSPFHLIEKAWPLPRNPRFPTNWDYFRIARDTSAIIGSNLARVAHKTRLARLGKSDAAHQVRKTRVTAEGIKEGMHFDVLQNR